MKLKLWVRWLKTVLYPTPARVRAVPSRSALRVEGLNERVNPAGFFGMFGGGMVSAFDPPGQAMDRLPFDPVEDTRIMANFFRSPFAAGFFAGFFARPEVPAAEAPAEAASFDVRLISKAYAGEETKLLVVPLDETGLPIRNYTGTVHFESTDPAVQLPEDYTFTAADRGRHVFDVIAGTTGELTVTVTQAETPAPEPEPDEPLPEEPTEGTDVGLDLILGEDVVALHDDGTDHHDDVKPVDEVPADPTTPVDETPVDEVPIDELPGDKTPIPVDEVPVDEVPTDPIDETPIPVDETPVDEVPTDPIDETPIPVDETPVDEVPTDPIDETPIDEVPTNPVDESPIDEVPTDPVDETPIDETPTDPTDPNTPVDETPTDPIDEVPVDETPTDPVDETPETPTDPVEPPLDETPTDPVDPVEPPVDPVDVTGVITFDVSEAPVATHFALRSLPGATAGDPTRFAVVPLDESNEPVANFTGVVSFTSSDPDAVLPADYTFTEADQGVHVFAAEFKTTGDVTLTATAEDGTTTGDVTVQVSEPAGDRGFGFSRFFGFRPRGGWWMYG